MTHESGIVGASICTSIATALAVQAHAAIPFAEKMASALILAMVAEAGRRLISRVFHLWSKK